MSYEIRPAEVMSGLKLANKTVKNIVGRADAIVPAVSAISSSPVLQGRGYDALGNSLKEEYTALASVFQIAGSNFAAANDKHFAALDYVSQYDYLNMNQILEEIDEIRDAIREIDRQISQINIDHTLSLRNQATFEWPDTSGLEDMREVWESRLETVEKKRDDFETYIATSAGLYDGTLDLLKCRIDRMDVATLCPDTGGLRVPTVEEFEVEELRAFLELYRDHPDFAHMSPREFNAFVRWEIDNFILLREMMPAIIAFDPSTESGRSPLADFIFLTDESIFLGVDLEIRQLILEELREKYVVDSTFLESVIGEPVGELYTGGVNIAFQGSEIYMTLPDIYMTVFQQDIKHIHKLFSQHFRPL